MTASGESKRAMTGSEEADHTFTFGRPTLSSPVGLLKSRRRRGFFGSLALEKHVPQGYQQRWFDRFLS